MMSNVVPRGNGQVPAILQQGIVDADDLSSGVSGGFAVLSIRASKWRIKYQGEEQPVLNADGDPVASLELVLLKANPHITKNYYQQGYSEGASEAPDCFSLDGLRPDAGAPKPQSQLCARCPKNVFGSRITPAGKKAKACQDNRRVAVVPIGDIPNDMYGGPMLLRVPAASLADLAMMGKNLKQRGFPYNAVSVRIGFDIEASYPKLTFRPVRPLTDEEAMQVLELMKSEKLDRILAEAVELDAAAQAAADAAVAVAPEPEPEPEPAAPVDSLFEQPVAPAPKKAAQQQDLFEQPAPAAAPKAAKKTAPAATKPAAAPKQAISVGADPKLEQDIEAILGELGSLAGGA